MERALALRGAAHCARALLDAGKTERERKYRVCILSIALFSSCLLVLYLPPLLVSFELS